MKIGLIMEESQLEKLPLVYKELKAAAEKNGHEVFDYTVKLSYSKVALLNAILLNSGAVDFIVTGCGTGMGAIIATNAFPNVHCGFVAEPIDGKLCNELNRVNAVSMPFAKSGTGADLNLRYCFEALFGEDAEYMSKKELEILKDYKKEWDELKAISQNDIMSIIKNVDKSYLKETVAGDKFKQVFFDNCKVKEIADYIQSVLAN